MAAEKRQPWMMTVLDVALLEEINRKTCPDKQFVFHKPVITHYVEVQPSEKYCHKWQEIEYDCYGGLFPVSIGMVHQANANSVKVSGK